MTAAFVIIPVFLTQPEYGFNWANSRETLGLTIGGITLLWLLWTAFKMKNPLRYSHLIIPENEVDFDKLKCRFCNSCYLFLHRL